jgi:VCBS repeat-containing protein
MRNNRKNRWSVFNSSGDRARIRRNNLRVERLEARWALATASPVAVNDFYHDLIDQPLEISGPGILSNDTSSTGNPLSAGLFSPPTHGTLDLSGDGSFHYMPEAGYVGLDSFLYFNNDGGSDSMLAAVTIDVGDGGPPPQVANDTYSLDEDGTLSIGISDGVLANDTAADGMSLSSSLVSGPANGTLSLGADGSFTYVPNANFNGSDSFTYSATDGAGDSAVATATITVNPVNDKPTATNDAFSTSEDTTLTVDATGGILTNDTDVDGDVLTPTVTSQPLHGTLVMNADGSFSYTPEANYNGLDGFSYLVSDGTTTSDVASATIMISPVNDSPVPVNDQYTTAEDTPLTIDAPGVLTNDTDVDGDALSSILVNPPQFGTVTLGPDGGLIYTPNANFNGVDGFSYLANDGSADSDAAAVTITVTPVNDAPAGTADAYTTDEDTPLVVKAVQGVLANDSDVDGDPMTATLVTGPTNGTLTLNADGSFNYAPNANFNGTDSFVYSAGDGTLSSEATTVSLTINPANDAPVSAADSYTTDEDTPLTIDATTGVLANDSDTDGDPMTATLITGPTNGTLTLNSDGSFNYAPNANFNGADSFVYSAGDGTLSSDATTVSLTINPVNDAPVTAADEYHTSEDAALTIDATAGVLANDSDVDGDALTAALVTGPTSGTLTLNPDGSFNYVPNANFNGSDSFTYQANDGTIATDPTTVTIDVCPANDAPTTADDSYSLDQGTTLTVDALTGVLANDSDIDGDALSASVVTGPANGSLSLNPDGSFSYTPNATFSGTDSFVYGASDGSLTTQSTVTLTVNPVAQAPIAAIDNYSTGEDVPLVVGASMGVLANDISPDGGTLTASVVTGPTNGTLSLKADGSFNYTPAANFHGNDSFTYKATSSNGQEIVSSANVVIEALNDAPVAADDSFTIDPTSTASPTSNAPVNNVMANDSDIDGDPLAANLVSGPAHGTLSLNSDGTFNYTPQDGFTGDDAFRYQLFDGKANSNVATVTLHVSSAPEQAPPPVETPPPSETPPPVETPPPSVNLPPVAGNDVFTTAQDTALAVPATTGLLANDSDPEGSPLTASLFANPLHGSVMLQGDGSFNYTPTTGYSGMDAFMYRVSDGMQWSPLAAVTIHVTPANSPSQTPTPSPDPAPVPTPAPAPTPDPAPSPEPCHPHDCCHVADHIVHAVAHGHHGHELAHAVDKIFSHVRGWLS